MFAEHKQFQVSASDAKIDHRAMIMAMIAAQGASPAAAAQIHHDVARNIADCQKDAMATLMQARPGWLAAAGVLEGSFHPGIAEMINANSL